MNTLKLTGAASLGRRSFANNLLLCLAFALPVAAATGCTGAKASDAYFVKVDSQTATPLSGVGVDDESYASVVAMLGYEPRGLASIGPRENGEMVIRFEMAPQAESPFVDQLLAFQAGVGEAPTDLSIFVGDDSATAGLLLPAVQNVRASGVRRDENDHVKLVFEVSGTGGKVDSWANAVPERQTAGDSFFDITYEFDSIPSNSPAEKLRIEEARGPFATIVAAFGRTTLAGTVPTEEFAFYYAGSAVELLVEEQVPAAGIVEVISPDGRPVIRMSVLGSQPAVNQADGTVYLSGGEAHVITYTGLENASTDTAAQVALFTSGYPVYDSSAVDAATRNLLSLRDALAVSGKFALIQWHGGTADGGGPVAETKTVTTANLFETVLTAVVSENLACTMATPDTIKAGKDPAINGGLNRDIIRRTAGRLALAALIAPPPGRLTIKMKDLLVSSLGEMPEPDGGDTAAQCDAIAALASVLELDSVNFSTVPTDIQGHLRTIGNALSQHRAAYLDRLVFEFVEHMNARLPTDVGGEEPWATAAKTKADILIESLGYEATNGPLMRSAARDLLGQ